MRAAVLIWWLIAWSNPGHFTQMPMVAGPFATLEECQMIAARLAAGIAVKSTECVETRR